MVGAAVVAGVVGAAVVGGTVVAVVAGTVVVGATVVEVVVGAALVVVGVTERVVVVDACATVVEVFELVDEPLELPHAVKATGMMSTRASAENGRRNLLMPHLFDATHPP